MNNIDKFDIVELLDTPSKKSFHTVDIGKIKLKKVSAETMHSLYVVASNPFSHERKSYYRIVEDTIKKYQKDTDNPFQEALFVEALEEIAGTLAPHFVIGKGIGINILLNDSEEKLDKNIVRIINTALTLGYITLEPDEITVSRLNELARKIKDEPVYIYFYNYWDLNEYNVFYNRDDEEVDYFDIKFRKSSIDRLWLDLDRLHTYFLNAGTRERRYRPVLYLDTPITREIKKRWLDFKCRCENNPIVDDYGDIHIELDFRKLKINVQILDENIRKHLLFDLRDRRVKDWEGVRQLFYEAEDYIFRYFLNHPFNRRFEKLEKVNEIITAKAVFSRIESNELGQAFEEPKEDFKLIKVHEGAEYFDYIKIYQYGDLNLYYVCGSHKKRSVNFGAFFVDLTPEDMESLRYIEEMYLSVLADNIIKNKESFYTEEKFGHLIPSINPGKLALQIIKDSTRIKRVR